LNNDVVDLVSILADVQPQPTINKNLAIANRSRVMTAAHTIR